MQLVVGRIGRAHGVRGEVTVEVRTDDPASRFHVGALLQTEPAKFGPLKIVSARDNNGTLLLAFEGRESRNAIEELRNVLLLADVSIMVPDTDSNEFHATQIIGCQVFNEDGKELGVVVDVLQLPAQDTLVVDYNGRELLIPFVTKHVPKVDIAKKLITASNLEGLL